MFGKTTIKFEHLVKSNSSVLSNDSFHELSGTAAMEGGFSETKRDASSGVPTDASNEEM